MKIQDAIQKAINGGWRPTKYVNYSDENMVAGLSVFYDKFAQAQLCLDPLFWQALGKSMGWGKFETQTMFGESSGRECEYWESEPIWKYHWHRLIDHLAEGGTIESYFEKL